MRISTLSLYNENVATMNNLQGQIARSQQQIASGRRIINPADDPAGAARAVELTLSDATNTQYDSNRAVAVNNLSLAESVLSSVTTLLHDVRVLAVNAGNGTVTDADRRSLANDIQGRLQELIGLANSTDGESNYLFSGAQGSTQPFVSNATGVAYQGDDVQRKVQAAATRQIAISDSGADVFMRIRNGNGTFQAAPVATNSGTGTITQGTVTNAALYNNNLYQVVFTVTGTGTSAVTTYDITDITAGPPGTAVVTAAPYKSGQAISFNGIQFAIEGAPANTDTFNISPSTNQSLFATLGNLVATLNGPVSSTQATLATYHQGLNDALGTINAGLDNILNFRASMGARLRELDALQTSGDTTGLQLKQTLSKIQDTDYNKAISELTLEQTTLQAAQQSFAKISKMSLFDYM